MFIDENALQKSEKILFMLRSLYMKYGYRLYKMGKFEEYDFYARNKDFLVSDNVITFTDTTGKLMALKPDVTLSIIKNSEDDSEGIQKLFYNENVYRVSKGSGAFKEIMQVGVECFGAVDEECLCEVMAMALESIRLISDDGMLVVSNLDVLNDIIGRIGITAEKIPGLYKAAGEKNFHEIDELCREAENADILKELLSVHGRAEEVIQKLYEMAEKYALPSLKDFSDIMTMMVQKRPELSDGIFIDFLASEDINYYNGIVFKGFVKNVPQAVLSGGQYDNLMMKLKRRARTVGFAVYTDELELLDKRNPDNMLLDEEDEYINVALPKGRLGDKVYDAMAKAGYECPSILEPNRKLIFENPDKKVRYFWVKPSDVAIYVERGAADIGVAGKDILLEYEPMVYELLDMRMGRCKMAVAAPKGFTDDGMETLRVATKFSHIAREFYQSKGRNIDIIHLNGSIEIAPILGLSDVIVDIVETGTTLRENNLEVIEDIVPISARLIANKSSMKFKNKAIEKLVERLTEAIL